MVTCHHKKLLKKKKNHGSLSHQTFSAWISIVLNWYTLFLVLHEFSHSGSIQENHKWFRSLVSQLELSNRATAMLWNVGTKVLSWNFSKLIHFCSLAVVLSGEHILELSKRITRASDLWVSVWISIVLNRFTFVLLQESSVMNTSLIYPRESPMLQNFVILAPESQDEFPLFSIFLLVIQEFSVTSISFNYPGESPMP